MQTFIYLYIDYLNYLIHYTITYNNVITGCYGLDDTILILMGPKDFYDICW